jgi:hypothetical protein
MIRKFTQKQSAATSVVFGLGIACFFHDTIQPLRRNFQTGRSSLVHWQKRWTSPMGDG